MSDTPLAVSGIHPVDDVKNIGNGRAGPRDGGSQRTGRVPGKGRRQRATTEFSLLSSQVQEAGLMGRRRGYYWVRFALLTVVLSGLVALFIHIGNSWWQLCTAAVFALVFTQIAFLGHDAAHRQIFQSGRWNNWASLVISNLYVGMSVGWWNNKHNRHHGNPNRVGYDPDIQIPVVRTDSLRSLRSRSAVVRWVLDHQSVGFTPFLLFQGLILHVQSLKRLFGRGPVQHRSVGISMILVRLVGFTGLVFLVLSPGRALAFLGLQLAVFGFYLGTVFAVNHMGMPLVPKDVKLDFFRRQTLTARDIRGGRLAAFLMGGLNYQIEHHLFPSMARPNLRRAAQVIKRFCDEHDVRYTRTGLAEALRSVTAYIDSVGLGHQDPFECPLIAARRSGAPIG